MEPHGQKEFQGEEASQVQVITAGEKTPPTRSHATVVRRRRVRRGREGDLHAGEVSSAGDPPRLGHRRVEEVLRHLQPEAAHLQGSARQPGRHGVPGSLKLLVAAGGYLTSELLLVSRNLHTR